MPNQLTPTHIAETVLYVDDFERAVRFYTTLFGCEVVRQDDHLCALRIHPEQMLLLFRRGGSLLPTETPGGTIPPHDGQGPLHVCFGMAGDSVTRWETHLRALKIPLESRVTWPGGGVSLYFRDPDGHAVELATPGLWR